MRNRIFIPYEVKESIKKHLRDAIDRSVQGYLSANEDEDTLTGHLGGLLQIRSQNVEVIESQISGIWTWEIDYYKFRGRGAGATEKILGADGILELKVTIGSRTDRKSLLFQAKNDWSSDTSLFEQCLKMSTWREAAFMINYTPYGYYAYPIDDVIRVKGVKNEKKPGIPLQDYLGNEFLGCQIGDTELYYNARRRKLIWRSRSGEIVATQFSIGRRISINVKSPTKSESNIENVDKEISNDEIYNYRMDATEEEILSLGTNYTTMDIKKSKKYLAQTYHPDRFTDLEGLNKQLIERRMQEINNAFDYVYSKSKKKSNI